jgi:hypothetical protein
LAAYSNAKIFFQSSFMLMTIRCCFIASSHDDCENAPIQVPLLTLDYPLLKGNGRPFRAARSTAPPTPYQAIGLATS